MLVKFQFFVEIPHTYRTTRFIFIYCRSRRNGFGTRLITPALHIDWDPTSSEFTGTRRGVFAEFTLITAHSLILYEFI